MGRDCYGPSLLWAEMSRNRTNLQPVTLYIDTFICFLTLSVFDDLALKKGSK